MPHAGFGRYTASTFRSVLHGPTGVGPAQAHSCHPWDVSLETYTTKDPARSYPCL